MQPVFQTARFILRPRTLADTDACLAMDNEPDVTRFVRGPWHDPAAHRAFVEARTRGPYPAGQGYWSISPREAPDRFLGWVLLIPEDAVGPKIEIGWRLRPEAWGGGVATEAAHPLLIHAFGTLGLAEVVADIDVANRASARVAEKIGMRLRGPVPPVRGTEKIDIRLKGLLPSPEIPVNRYAATSKEFLAGAAARP